MRHRNFAVRAALIFLVNSAVLARADQFEDFKKRAATSLLEPFAKDIGGLLGGGSFHMGRSLGFPGADVGVHLTLQREPSSDDKILKDANVSNLVLPMAQAEIGLPYNVDVIVRGITYQEIAIVGAGVRYGLFKWKLLPLTPAMSVSAITHVFNHSFFSVTHYAANVVVDVSVPIVSPYVGVGLDYTTIKIKESTDASLVGLTASASGLRASGGLNLKFLPFIYLHGGYTYLHGQQGYEAGLGIRF